MNDTPRTNAVVNDKPNDWAVTYAASIINLARTLERELVSAQERIAELEKDAERYRFIRHGDVTFETPDGPNFVSYIPELGHDGSKLDAQIDNAIAARNALKGKS